jgi:hypothetical protein
LPVLVVPPAVPPPDDPPAPEVPPLPAAAPPLLEPVGATGVEDGVELTAEEAALELETAAVLVVVAVVVV